MEGENAVSIEELDEARDRAGEAGWAGSGPGPGVGSSIVGVISTAVVMTDGSFVGNGWLENGRPLLLELVVLGRVGRGAGLRSG